MVSPWKYFDLHELKCHCGKCKSTGLEMDMPFMNMIVMLRHDMGIPFIITSAYRCPSHNKKVSFTGENGPHTTGKAIDIQIVGKSALDLFGKALHMGFTGFGVNQKGVGGRFIHLDNCTPPHFPRPNIWSY